MNLVVITGIVFPWSFMTERNGLSDSLAAIAAVVVSIIHIFLVSWAAIQRINQLEESGNLLVLALVSYGMLQIVGFGLRIAKRIA